MLVYQSFVGCLSLKIVNDKFVIFNLGGDIFKSFVVVIKQIFLVFLLGKQRLQKSLKRCGVSCQKLQIRIRQRQCNIGIARVRRFLNDIGFYFELLGNFDQLAIMHLNLIAHAFKLKFELILQERGQQNYLIFFIVHERLLVHQQMMNYVDKGGIFAEYC